MNFRDLEYTRMDEDNTYLSPSPIYRILKKHDLVTDWKRIP